jgi:sulfonate transport system permease protein
MTIRLLAAAKTATLGAVPLILLAALWQGAANAGLIDPQQWASPWLVVQAFGTQFSDPQFWTDLGASLVRGAEGTAIGILIGTLGGLGLGASGAARALVLPTLDSAKAIPIFTWVPLLSIWAGSGEGGKVTFIAIATALPALFSSAEGVISVPSAYRELTRQLCLPRLTAWRRAFLPGAMPGILRGLHLALLYGWLATIGAEYFFQSGAGIGGNIMGARELYALDLVVADMLVIGAIGIALDGTARALETYLLRWQGKN